MLNKIKYYIVYLFIVISLSNCTKPVEIIAFTREYPADGISSGRVIIEKDSGAEQKKSAHSFTLEGNPSSIEIIDIRKEPEKDILYFKSTTIPGRVIIKNISGKKLILRFYKITSDEDKDGFPDRAELDKVEDRRAFINWFVRIAESQYLKRNYSWKSTERDCAGLIRYCYKEALKKHDNQWIKKSGIVLDKNLPDVKKFNFPKIPDIGHRLFKVKEGRAEDINSFGYFADAKTMINLNTKFITRDIREARKGDIIFFHDEKNSNFPYHSMIVSENLSGKITVIYHTGENDRVKRVPLSYLNNSVKFRPEKWNSNYLGVFRFNILL